MSPKNYIPGCIAAILLAAAAQTNSTSRINDASASTGSAATLTKFEVKSIPPKVTYQFDRGLGPGRMLKARDGKSGSVKRVVQYQKKNGKLVKPIVLWEERKPAQDAILLIGRSGWTSTRGGWTRNRVLTMEATGYSEAETSGRTAMGLHTGYGIVAVDPRVIKLGTRVYVEGYGFAIAGDTGGAIKGNRIDLCFNSYAAAMKFGRRKVVVHILE